MFGAVPPRPTQNLITWLMDENRLLIYQIYSRSLECLELCFHALHKTSLHCSWTKTLLIYQIYSRSLECVELCLHGLHKTSLPGSWVKAGF